MFRTKSLHWWETKVGNCEVILQFSWPTAKLFTKKNGLKATTAVHGSLGITYRPNEKANVIADCLENQLTFHELCDEKHERQVETEVQALLAPADETPWKK
jgi:hypothetical protein